MARMKPQDAFGRPFGEEAEKYWTLGLSPIPVEPSTKQPARGLLHWTSYGNNLPKPATRAEWLAKYGGYNIGLCMGTEFQPGYRIAAVDVDDERFLNAVAAVIEEELSSKVGKKGKTWFVKVSSSTRLRSTALFTAEKAGAIDFLYTGKMTVMPPSIHPESKSPYRWVTSSLSDVDLKSLPTINESSLGVLRSVVGSPHSLVLITGKTTHNAGVCLAGELVSLGCDSSTITKIFEGLLPESYSGNSLEELPEWIESAQRKGFDRETHHQSTKKGSADKLIELFERSRAALFHDEGHRGYVTVPVAGGQRTFAIRSSNASMWLSKLFYEEFGKAIGERPMEEVLRLLDAKAQFAAPLCPVSLRVAGDSSEIAIDLGREDGLLVKLTATSWSLQHEPRIKLVRSPGFGQLPSPVNNGNLRDLQALLGLDEQNWQLVLAFLLLCLRPKGPYMLLLVEGEQGTGKSFLCKILKMIIDPNQIEKARLPDSQRDLMIHAKDYFLLVFDNVSGMKGDLSDALCVLATGGGFATRRLYTDDELLVLNFCRPVVINGIADFVNRPDLLERSIPLRLTRIEDGQRKTEQEMLREFEELLPGILGSLYGIAAKALACSEDITSAATLRMADCERWLVACERFSDVPSGSFVAAIKACQDEIFIDRAQNDPVVGALLSLLKNGSFKGTVLDLHNRIIPLDGFEQRSFPATPSHLSKHLKRQRPAMAKLGILFELEQRTREGRIVHIWLDGERGKRGPERESNRAPDY